MDDYNLMEQHSVPVIEEELVTGTREVKTGAVRVRKEVERTRKEVEMPLRRDIVNVSRIAVNRVVELMPEIREEGDILVVPVVEEEIVVHKRLVLKEEIHIHRRRETSHVTQTVDLEREHAILERLDVDGNVVSTSSSDAEIRASTDFFSRHKPLLR